VCVPTCPSGCVHGECIAPNTCVCNDGFVADLKLSNRCVVKCSGGCINGNCTVNRTCECHEGWAGTDCSMQMDYIYDYPTFNTVQ
jgi:hypothetical protein